MALVGLCRAAWGWYQQAWAPAAGWDAADPLAEAVMDTAGPREINASFLDFSLPFALPFGDFSLPFFTAFP